MHFRGDSSYKSREKLASFCMICVGFILQMWLRNTDAYAT